MIRLIIFFGLILLLPVFSYANYNPTELSLFFSNHCEKSDNECIRNALPVQNNVFVSEVDELRKEIKLDLMIKNPKKEMITSVKTKIKFDTNALKVTNLDVDNSDFNLKEPLSNYIDEKTGTINIGASFVRGSQNNEEFFVATISLIPINNGTQLTFLNFQPTEISDTLILFVNGIKSENKLKTQPSPLVFTEKGSTNNVANQNSNSSQNNIVSTNNTNNANSNQSSDTTTVSSTASNNTNISSSSNQNTSSQNLSINNQIMANDMMRPKNLLLKTSLDGTVTFIWEMDDNPKIKGYYLYYSNSSGYYIRRKDVGKTNFAEVSGFDKGKKYFFAIRSYDALDKESDYSDEVFVNIGNPGSESHPFIGDPRTISSQNDISNNTAISSVATPNQSQNNLSKVNKSSDSGPKHVFFLLIFSIGISFIFFAYRYSNRN